MSLPGIQIVGPKFWAITAIVSGLFTLSVFMTGLAEAVGFRPWDGSRPIELLCVGMYVMFVAALYVSFVGMGSMILCGLRDVGRIEARGRLLPDWVMPLLCGAAYASPWTLVVLIRLLGRSDP